jgi:hypothetical protein
VVKRCFGRGGKRGDNNDEQILKNREMRKIYPVTVKLW